MNTMAWPQQLGLSITETIQKDFDYLIDEHIKWNKVFNLSAHRDRDSVLNYQLIDSLSVHSFINQSNLLDIGSGPGFPGLPLAILFPNLQVTLLDSNAKKLSFARHIKDQLQLLNITIQHVRIEKFQPVATFEQVITRAFTNLNDIIDVALPVLSCDGVILAMKGARVGDELVEAKLRYQNCKISIHQLPHIVNEQRNLAVVQRIMR